MTRIVDFAAPLGQKAGPGKWNDLDMLEVGNGGMSYDEYGTSFIPKHLSDVHVGDFTMTQTDLVCTAHSHALLDVVHSQESTDSWKRRDEYGTFHPDYATFPSRLILTINSLFVVHINYRPTTPLKSLRTMPSSLSTKIRPDHLLSGSGRRRRTTRGVALGT